MFRNIGLAEDGVLGCLERCERLLNCICLTGPDLFEVLSHLFVLRVLEQQSLVLALEPAGEVDVGTLLDRVLNQECAEVSVLFKQLASWASEVAVCQDFDVL